MKNKIFGSLFSKAQRSFGAFAPSAYGNQAVGGRHLLKFAYEGYQKNVIVYRAINLISRSFASVPWLLYKDKERLDSHPILDMLQHINPVQSRSTFFEAAVSYYLLTGNTFIQMVKDALGAPTELYVLRPDRVEVVPGMDGNVKGYHFTTDGKKRFIPANGEQGDVLHLKSFHPTQDWYGLSPLEAAAQAIDQHNTVSGHNLSLLHNGGRPTGALVVKTGAYGLTEGQREHLREDINQAYKGATNAGKLMILEGDFEWKEMGLSPKDMDFIEGKHQAAREIAQAFGVPPMLVGVPGDATFANYREARYHLWEDTVLPLLDHFIAEFNIWLVSYFGDTLRLSYDIEAIPALALRREATWQKIASAPFLTMNEKRQALGFSAHEGISGNKLPEIPL